MEIELYKSRSYSGCIKSAYQHQSHHHFQTYLAFDIGLFNPLGNNDRFKSIK